MSDARSHASDMNGSLRYYIPSKSSKKEEDDHRLYLMFIATAIRDYTTEAFVLSFMLLTRLHTSRCQIHHCRVFGPFPQKRDKPAFFSRI